MKIAVLTMAREGSKRLPGKNMKEFYRKPLIHYTLEAMYYLGYDSYLLSDYEKLKTYTSVFFEKVKIIDEKPEMAKDNADIMDAIDYAHSCIDADVYVLLQPTSPIRNIEKIKLWIDDFINSDYECGISVKQLSPRFYLNTAGYIGGRTKEPVFTENGSFYIYRKELLDRDHITDGKIKQYQDDYLVDIDTEQDFIAAENLFIHLLNQAGKK